MKRPSVEADKLKRIASGEKLRVLDLFCGCGGLSLGFKKAGFEIVAGVEFDDLAALSHARNFFQGHGDDWRRHGKPTDITKVDPADLTDSLGLGSPAKAFDVVIGGPPCQSFARVGRAKLREVLDHPEAFKLDPRKDLYLRFLDYVKAAKPLVVLMENVPDVINSGGHNVPEETCEVLDELGYECGYTLLNAAFYGVPQMRERMFLLAISKAIGTPVSFPKPTHWVKLPVGYEGSRSVALKNLRLVNGQRSLGIIDDCYYQHPPLAAPELRPAVTAREALADLPPITLHLEGGLKRGARRFDTLSPYRTDVEPSEYALAMRDWKGFESAEGVYDHVIRSLPRDYPIFRRMRPGDQYPQAYQHALEMLQEEVERLRAKGESVGKARLEALTKQIVPPYDATKFPNKWRKMEADLPARTLMAHIGKDSYSHIHYDSNQARTISVREAARLQSFPDGFVLSGTMNPAFRQVGNAVPPLMAYALAAHILKAIRQGIGNAKKARYQTAV